METLLSTTTPVNINEEDVLREFGLNGITNTRTVIQDTSSEHIIVMDGDATQSSSHPGVEDAEEIHEDSNLLEPAPIEPLEPTVSEEESVNLDNLSIEELASLLPVNSKSLELREATARFSGATWYSEIQNQTIIVAGIGGIGSWASMILTRMHPLQIFLYDDDTVEAVNLAGQLYGVSMLGTHKVDAMNRVAENFSDYHGIMAIPEKWDATKPGSDIMICGFDNMEARQTFFQSWLKHVHKSPHPEKCLYIDGRLAFNDMQVYALVGNDNYNITRFIKDCLFDDSEAEETVCSMKQTTYCASMIGSLIVNLFTNFVASLQDPIMYAVPFKTYYDSNLMYFKTEN